MDRAGDLVKDLFFLLGTEGTKNKSLTNPLQALTMGWTTVPTPIQYYGGEARGLDSGRLRVYPSSSPS